MGNGLTYERGSGQIVCDHCKKGISGEAVIGYKYESDYVDEAVIVHKDCVRPYKLQKAGKVHKCPKCNGQGSHLQDTMNIYYSETRSPEVVMSSMAYQFPERYRTGKLEKVRDLTKVCTLCDGDGYLEKEPIPVITDWRKAP